MLRHEARGLVDRLGGHDVVAREPLLELGERTVGDEHLAVSHSHGLRLLRACYGCTVAQPARRVAFLGPVFEQALILSLRHRAASRVGHVDHEVLVAHLLSPFDVVPEGPGTSGTAISSRRRVRWAISASLLANEI